MRVKSIARVFAAGMLICIMTGAGVLAQNPGGTCDPDTSRGHVARLDSYT